MRYRFTDFVLDDDRFELRRGRDAVVLRKKVFDLLVLLVRARARVVAREELVLALWDSTTVGSGSLSGLVNELRAALGETGRAPSVIRTVHARGYQFMAPVDELGRVAPSIEGPPRECARPWAGPMAASASGSVESRAARVESLVRARADVEGRGPQAWVCALPDAKARADWLAEIARDSERAGFTVRRSWVPATAAGGNADAAAEVAERVDEPSRPSRPSRREPIALCLEIDDPQAWRAAGGLVRLLDLLGRAPILVFAAFAAAPGDVSLAELVALDPRIERVAAHAPARAQAAEPDAASEASPRAHPFAQLLHALARIDAPGLEAALQTLGFVAAGRVPDGPVRVLRRVAPERATGEVQEAEAS